MERQFVKQPALDPVLMICPHCQEETCIGIHSIHERRYRCHACGHTFAETKGTLFFGCHYPNLAYHGGGDPPGLWLSPCGLGGRLLS